MEETMPVPVCGYILSYFCNLGMRFFTTHAADAFFVGAGGAFTTIFFRKAKIILEDVKDSKQCCEKNKQNGVGKFWLVKDFIIFLRDVTLSTKKIFKYVTYCFIGGFFSVLLTYGIENSQRLLIESLTVGIGTELIFFKIFRKDKEEQEEAINLVSSINKKINESQNNVEKKVDSATDYSIPQKEKISELKELSKEERMEKIKELLKAI